jgi:hypothetical protein
MLKKILFIVVLACGLSFASRAQVTKTEVQKLMTELGTSPEQIENVTIFNTMKFFNDGTNTRSFEEYSETNGEYKNQLAVYDTGLGIQTTKNGEVNTRYFYPYTSISYIQITKTGMWIYLKN